MSPMAGPLRSSTSILLPRSGERCRCRRCFREPMSAPQACARNSGGEALGGPRFRNRELQSTILRSNHEYHRHFQESFCGAWAFDAIPSHGIRLAALALAAHAAPENPGTTQQPLGVDKNVTL